MGVVELGLPETFVHATALRLGLQLETARAFFGLTLGGETQGMQRPGKLGLPVAHLPGLLRALPGFTQAQARRAHAGLNLQGLALILPAALPAAGEFSVALNQGLTQGRGRARQAGEPARGQCRIADLQVHLTLAPGVGQMSGHSRFGAGPGQREIARGGPTDGMKHQFSLQPRVVSLHRQRV